MELRIRPEPSEPERRAIERALAAATPPPAGAPAYASPWRAAGLAEATRRAP